MMEVSLVKLRTEENPMLLSGWKDCVRSLLVKTHKMKSLTSWLIGFRDK